MRSPRHGSRNLRQTLRGALAICGLLPLVGCQAEYAGMSLPSMRYLTDDVQYFKPGPHFPYANTQAATQRARMELMGIDPNKPDKVATKDKTDSSVKPADKAGAGGASMKANDGGGLGGAGGGGGGGALGGAGGAGGGALGGKPASDDAEKPEGDVKPPPIAPADGASKKDDSARARDRSPF